MRVSDPLWWLQDRLGWKVTVKDENGYPVVREPRRWNWYGRRMMRRYIEATGKSVSD